jgi:hypothetical protein
MPARLAITKMNKEQTYIVTVRLVVKGEPKTHWGQTCAMDFVSRKIDEGPAVEGRVLEWAFLSVLPAQARRKGERFIARIPDSETLTLRARGYYEWKLSMELLDLHRALLKEKAAAMPLPPDLEPKVAALLQVHPTWSWEKAVLELADAFLSTTNNHTEPPGSPQERSESARRGAIADGPNRSLQGQIL